MIDKLKELIKNNQVIEYVNGKFIYTKEWTKIYNKWIDESKHRNNIK